jgi:hypothetical protein
VRLEGLGQLKNPMISSGIEPTTFPLVLLITIIVLRTGCIFNLTASRSLKKNWAKKMWL